MIRNVHIQDRCYRTREQAIRVIPNMVGREKEREWEEFFICLTKGLYFKKAWGFLSNLLTHLSMKHS